MTVNQNNYFDVVQTIDISKLNPTLRESHGFVVEATNNGKSWGAYNSDKDIKEMMDIYFDKLSVQLKRTGKPKSKISKARKSAPAPKPKKTNVPPRKTNAKKVEAISDEIKLLKRLKNMHGKVKSKHQIRLFVNAIQKAIVEKRVRKSSAFAKEIEVLQNGMIKLHNDMKEGEERRIELDMGTLNKTLEIIGEEEQMISVRFIKSYIGLQGKIIENKRAKSLHNRIANAINKGKLEVKDKYYDKVEKILGSLKEFVQKNKSQGKLVIHHAELNGLMGVLNGCGCDKNELGYVGNAIPQNTIMSSTDIVDLEFEKLGFRGKWRNLIGDPSPGFTAMIYGKPKMGKSYLSVDFAGYLARNHGSVLYVAREEGIDDTLQAKLREKNVAHPNLFVSDYLPADLSAYEFVFLDSVTKLQLSPEDLEQLKKTNPATSFIYIFQVTKNGVFRGANDFAHDVDVLIEVPEKGYAVQNGRFNQGGEMEIF